MTVASTAALALPATLLAAASGQGAGDFRACWLALRRAGLVPAAVVEQVAAVAQQCNLPNDLVAALS